MQTLSHDDPPSTPKLTGNRCLCRGCNQYFSTVANFDRHRRNGECRPPDTVGLVQVGGIWKCAEKASPEALVRIRGRGVQP